MLYDNYVKEKFFYIFLSSFVILLLVFVNPSVVRAQGFGSLRVEILDVNTGNQAYADTLSVEFEFSDPSNPSRKIRNIVPNCATDRSAPRCYDITNRINGKPQTIGIARIEEGQYFISAGRSGFPSNSVDRVVTASDVNSSLSIELQIQTSRPSSTSCSPTIATPSGPLQRSTTTFTIENLDPAACANSRFALELVNPSGTRMDCGEVRISSGTTGTVQLNAVAPTDQNQATLRLFRIQGLASGEQVCDHLAQGSQIGSLNSELAAPSAGGTPQTKYRYDSNQNNCVADPAGVSWDECQSQIRQAPQPPPPPCLEFVDNKCVRVTTAIGDIPTDITEFAKVVFGILLSISGGIALLLIIYSGYRIMTSSGKPETLQSARETLTSAIIGLLFMIFSLVLLQVIGVDILKIPDFNP